MATPALRMFVSRRFAATCEPLEEHVLLSTWYVAPNGTDASGHGTSPTNAWKTINYGVNHIAYGDTLYIEGGTYRETVTLPAFPATDTGKQTRIQNYDSTPVIIKGSDVVTGWTLYSGTIWMKTGWTTFSRQVFVDYDSTGNGPLTEIGQASATSNDSHRYIYGSNQSSMFPGSFYDDTTNHVLYVQLPDGSNPNNHVIEASTRQYWIFWTFQSNNNYANPQYLIQGLNFSQNDSTSVNASNGKPSAGITLPPYSTLQNCNIRWADFSGTVPMGANDNFLDNNIAYCGDDGIQVGTNANYLISGNTITYNNYRFYQGWNCGGMKIIPNAYGTVSNNEVAYNNGPGIWLDTDDSGNWSYVFGNYVHDNIIPVELHAPTNNWTIDDTAIDIEISKNVMVYNNVVTNNGESGISSYASDTVYIFNNTVVGNYGYAGIKVGASPRNSGSTSQASFVNYPLQHNRVYNNLIYNNLASVDLEVEADFTYQYTFTSGTPTGTFTYTGATDNLSDYNLIYRHGGPLQLNSGDPYHGNMGPMQTTLGLWTSNTTGQSGMPVVMTPTRSMLIRYF